MLLLTVKMKILTHDDDDDDDVDDADADATDSYCDDDEEDDGWPGSSKHAAASLTARSQLGLPEEP